MPRIILRNTSQVFVHTNEVKIGQGAIGSCDSRLQHLGSFTLQAGQSQEVASVTETTDGYWKNVNAYIWIHKVASRFNEETVLETSGTDNSDGPVDECQ